MATTPFTPTATVPGAASTSTRWRGRWPSLTPPGDGAPGGSIPEGWYPVDPIAPGAVTSPEHRHHRRQRAPDALGLTRAVDAARLKVPRLSESSDGRRKSSSSSSPLSPRVAALPLPTESGHHKGSPRHQRLVKRQMHPAMDVILDTDGGARGRESAATYMAADAFSPKRSLRLAALHQPAASVPGVKTPTATTTISSSGGGTAAARCPRPPVATGAAAAAPLTRHAGQFMNAESTMVVPLPAMVQNFDDAVDASPFAESNQAAITGLFIEDWIARFECDRPLYKSVAVHAEVAFQELYRLTTNVAFPNDLVTSFACKIFEDMTVHFGPYAKIMQVLSSELRLSIYEPPKIPAAVSSSSQPHEQTPSPLSYFAIAKNQKCILLSLRKELQRRQERNSFLRYEINQVQSMFLYFMEQCAYGLQRTIFREWYSVAIVQKRNSKKYIEYFSAWFGGSAKSLIPRIFTAWKHLVMEAKVTRMHDDIQRDHEHVAGLQQQIEELSRQRDHVQVENLAIRNDRKHAEDTIQRLQRKIQSASNYLETSHRRVHLVAQEGQLRVEAVTYLPPLVLESLLRGFHNVGFLQLLHGEFIPRSTSATSATGSGGRPSLVQECLTTVAKLRAASKSGTGSGAEAPQPASDVRQTEDPLTLKHFVGFFHAIKDRLDDPSSNLLFIPRLERARSSVALASQVRKLLQLPHASQFLADARRQTVMAELVRLYERILRNVRIQDEHYARHPKLFSSRMPETQTQEISVAPRFHASILSLHKGDSAGGDLGVINGARRFSLLNVHPVKHALRRRQSARHLLNENADGAGPSTGGDGEVVVAEPPPLICTGDFEMTPRHTRAFILLFLSHLATEYGSLLFPPTDLSAFMRNRRLQEAVVLGISGGRHQHPGGDTAGADGGGLEQIWDENDDDDGTDQDEEGDMDNEDGEDDANDDDGHSINDETRGGTEEKVEKDPAPRKRSDRKSLPSRSDSSSRLPPATMTASRDVEKGIASLMAAYEVWNRLSLQLLDADLVHAQNALGAAEPIVSGGTMVVDAPIGNGNGRGGNGGGAGAHLASGGKSTPSLHGSLRPRLHLHIEPHSHGVLLTASKQERDVAAATTSASAGGHRLSMQAPVPPPENAFEHARIRRLSSDDVRLMTASMHELQTMLEATARRMGDFDIARGQLRELRQVQWHQAAELASQFAHASSSSASHVGSSSASSPSATSGVDDRRHVYECIHFDNPAIERLLGLEDHPEEELERVRRLFERKKHLVRHLYSRPRVAAGGASSSHPGPSPSGTGSSTGGPHSALTAAVTLDDLWHVIKVLRLPRDVHVLPTMRDEDFAGGASGYEQLFSVEDLAEVLLQLCNEQFYPQVTPLSARVEVLLTQHLPRATQNRSIIREVMHRADVKRALLDHSQTLRIIFRRYCAKEKDLLAAAAAKRRAAPSQQAQSSHPPGSQPTATGAGAPGITRFMRLVDWLEFVADYKLVRPRFTHEDATNVFRNVQEAESGLEEQLEMIYSEFCEAIVGISMCFFPDPFLKSATRVHQFIRRYLPVSPEEVREHT